MSELEIALKAVELYATMHPRPSHVNLTQAAELLSVSQPTVRKLVRNGKLRTNACGLIPMAEIDKALQ